MTCVTPRQVTNLLSPLLSPSPPRKGKLARNRQSFRNLLQTYNSYEWFNKPLQLSPMMCARWGWACAGKDLLECKLCKIKLQFVCAIPTWHFEQYKEICELFAVKVQTSHLTVCAWHTKPCSEDALFGGRSSLTYDKAAFTSTWNELCQGQVAQVTVPGSVLTKVWSYLPKLCKTFNPIAEINVKHVYSLLMALCGWRKEEGNSLPTLHCKLCLRTLGMWNFLPLSATDALCTVSLEPRIEWTEHPSQMFSLHPPLTDDIRSRMSSSNTSDTSSVRSSLLSSRPEGVSEGAMEGVSEGVMDASPSSKDMSLQETPSASPKETPSASPKETPSTSPKETLSASPKETPSASPKETPSASPKETPSASPKETTSASPKETTSASPKETPSVSPKQTPATSPKDISSCSLKETPSSSPKEIPSVSPKETSSASPSIETTAASPSKETSSDSSSKETSSGSPSNETSSASPSKESASIYPMMSPRTPELQAEAENVRITRSHRARKITGTPYNMTPKRLVRQKIKSSDATLIHMEGQRRVVTRSGKSTPSLGPLVALPDRKRRKSKLEVIESKIQEVMNSVLPVLELKSVNNTPLNVVNEHHPWCPWVCKLPSYVIPKSRDEDTSKAPKVTTVDQVECPGWETLLLHMSADSSPGNAWLAVHNMLEDCVSPRM